MVVAEDNKAATATLDRMRAAGVPGTGEAIGGGFTEFTISRKAEEFFSQQPEAADDARLAKS